MGSVEQMSKDLRRIGSVMNKQEAKADTGKPKLTLVPRKIEKDTDGYCKSQRIRL